MGLSRESMPPHLRELVEQVEARETQRRTPPPVVADRERRTARAIRREPGRMNKTEKAYASHLSLRQKMGDIQEWAFEPEKLRLADATHYTPDFRVVLNSGEIEMHEVKGFWEDDARVKIKVAAAMHPYRFVAVKAVKGGGWEYEPISSVRQDQEAA